MDISKVINRLKNIVISPISEWENIKDESLSVKEIFVLYLFPLLLFGCSLKLIGRFLNFKDYTIIHAVSTCISYFAITVSIIFSSAWIINEILPKFKCEKQFIHVFKLITFSSFPSILLIGISSLHPDLTFINMFSVYSAVIFWLGISKILQIPNEFKIGFTLISLILIIIITLVLSFMLMSAIFSFMFFKF